MGESNEGMGEALGLPGAGLAEVGRWVALDFLKRGGWEFAEARDPFDLEVRAADDPSRIHLVAVRGSWPADEAEGTRAAEEVGRALRPAVLRYLVDHEEATRLTLDVLGLELFMAEGRARVHHYVGACTWEEG